jgi:hypothetical protein
MSGKIKKGKEKPCEMCGTLENVSLGPDPFLSDVHEDDTEHYLCADCRSERCEEI